jgi:hypothetical protein
MNEPIFRVEGTQKIVKTEKREQCMQTSSPMSRTVYIMTSLEAEPRVGSANQ